ncbi:hypothetical protein I3760_13G081400 [Carya illinoinensis]|nr:hypothetical protein I3760_13G081400 [Carya illinoinensis]
MAVGELFLSAFIQMLLLQMSREFLDFVRQEGIQEKLNKWRKTLSRLQAVLDDAEEKQYTSRAVKEWLNDLKDLAHDVEDILDEFATEALRRKFMNENQASTSMVRNLIPDCCLASTPTTFKINTRLGEKDKEAILELLLSEKSSDTKVSVIPILGMGGIGKTTLTQHVYNDEKVQLFFDLKAGDDLNLLQVKLKENLKGKKFLVILDDIWNENYHDWTILRAPFQAGGPGSAIIITTRNQGVSSMIGTTQAYRLQVLSNDACLSLFTTHALQTEDFSMHANLKDIGEEIVRRCKGLPLADYEFEEKQLVWLWMAEGLIQLQEGEKQMEELGSQYFHNLVSRSFFQQSSENKSRFLMHDLINDLAQSIAGDTCFKMEDGSEGSNKGKISKKARHSSYVVSSFDGTKKFELLPKLQYLRVLSLSSYYITELPDSIGNLKHLHYIDLSHTLIKSLPESMTTLYNLQTLLLENCPIEKLPSTFANLLNLHHLNILNADLLEGMPPQIGKLTSLQTLSNMFVGKGTCSKVKELGPLSHLEGMLCILRLENVVESKDASDANLIGKPNLSGLMFEWCSNIIEPQDDESQHKLIELEVLDVLQPHHTLKELTIKCYGGVEFPTWLRRPSFPNMVFVFKD